MTATTNITLDVGKKIKTKNTYLHGLFRVLKIRCVFDGWLGFHVPTCTRTPNTCAVYTNLKYVVIQSGKYIYRPRHRKSKKNMMNASPAIVSRLSGHA